MGLDALRNIAESNGQTPDAERKILDLVPGNRMENIEELINLRLEFDGPYLRLKRRGGTTAQKSFFGSINTMYGFSARINNVLKDFIAVHNTAGDVILWNVTDDTTSTVMSGFPTSGKIQLAHSGIFLYGFSYDAGVAKYYDIEKTTAYDFLAYDQPYIHAATFISGSLLDDNFLGYSEGDRVLVFANNIPASGEIIKTGADGDSYIDPLAYDVRSFYYKYDGGQFITDADGNQYKENRWITLQKNADPWKYTVGGSGNDFEIQARYLPLDENGDIALESFVTTVDKVNATSITFKDRNGVEISMQIGFASSSNYNDKHLALPYNDDMEDLVGQPLSKKLQGSSIVTNGDYTLPTIYRQYVIVDLLNDGSVTLPGKPWQVELSPTDLLIDGATYVRLSATAASANVEKRYLFATRWQTAPEKAFQPSSPAYDNSPLFFAKEVRSGAINIDDETPDSDLLSFALGRIPLNGGVPDLFGTGSLLPNSIAKFKGSLMMAGYQVDRPIPKPYTDATLGTDENIFVDIQATTQLPNNMALAFLFEYTDGKKSNIVETEEFLQEGSTTTTQPVACDQVKATGQHTVTQGTQTDGSLEVTYEGITVVVALTAASHPNASDVATAIQQAVNGDADIRISASLPSSDAVKYTEKRFGEEFNTNVVDIEPVIEAATGSIDVDANNLAGSSSENHTITIDGNSTAAITINDTDTLEQIVDKYVSEINGDPTISADWTASKVDNGDGTWRCLITADATGTTWNGKVISISGDVDVTVVVNSPTSGGADDPGVTFNTQDPTLNLASEPEGTPAKGFIAIENNSKSPGSPTEQHEIFLDGASVGTFNVDGSDSEEQLAEKLRDAFNPNPDWTAAKTSHTINGITYWGVTLTSDHPGDESYNDLEFFVDQPEGFVLYEYGAPGRTWLLNSNDTNGASEGCTQATASMDVSANGLAGSSSEDHTLTIDGNATSPITINDTDTTEQIVDKYIAEIQATTAIDLDWKATKADQGGGTWRLLLTFREYGSTGNSRAISISGDVDVTVTVNSPSSGGSDAGTIPSGSATEVNANRLQIHSLNSLVSKIYILGRTTSGGTTFHPIKEVGIEEAGAHGMIIDLPNTQAELDDIEADTFPSPSANDVREQVNFQNFYNVGTPFQQFTISGQQPIVDESEILRAIPLDFDIDKTQMRYRFLMVTDNNLQLAYLVESGGQFEKDIEVFYEGIRIKSGTRAGITLLENNRVLMHTDDGIKLFDSNQVRKLIDDREYDLVKNDTLVGAVLNRTHNEYWMIFSDQKVLVYDLEVEDAVKTFSFDGPGISGSVRDGIFTHGNLTIAIGGQLCYTDLAGTHDDLGEGPANSHYINAHIITKHLGTPNLQTKILEIDVGGQTYNCQVFLDLQRERLESNTGTWDKVFANDKTSTVKQLDISGTSFQFHNRAIMPKIKITLTGDGDGFISHVTLKHRTFDNRGKARV